jgi:carbon starvation protein CstA
MVKLQRLEFQSPRRRMLERVRNWVALTSLMFVAAIFWGAITAGLVKYLFALTQEETQVVFVPAAIIVGLYCYFIRYKLTRAAGFDD